jgi:hypothetical protein
MGKVIVQAAKLATHLALLLTAIEQHCPYGLTDIN